MRGAVERAQRPLASQVAFAALAAGVTSLAANAIAAPASAPPPASPGAAAGSSPPTTTASAAGTAGAPPPASPQGPTASASSPAPASAAEPIRFEYDAPASCPGEDAFIAQVLARTQLARRAVAGEVARSFAVSVWTRGASVVGRLTVGSASGERSERTVSASNCTDLVGALALVAALTVDPAASTAPLVPAAPPAPPAPPTAPAPVSPAPREPAPRRTPREPVRSPAAPARQAHTPNPWSGSAGVLVGLTGAVAPEPLPLLGIFASVARREGGVLEPAVGVSIQAGRVTATNSTSNVTFTWVAGRLDACPIAWRPWQSLALRPCAALDAGMLRADPDASSALATRQGQSRIWLSADALARVEWHSGLLLLRLEGGARFPLVRDRFVFNRAGGGENPVHDVPALGGFAGAGAGVRF